MSDFFSLSISAVKQLTPNSVSVEFEIPENLSETFIHIPGQYVTLKHMIGDSEIRRAYSICSTPNSENFSVGIKKVKDGSFSVYANESLKVGDAIDVMAPEGHFKHQPISEASNHYMAIAAGSGITPILSIIGATLDGEPTSKFVLLYGNQSLEETMFHNALEGLKQQYPGRFQIEYIFSRKKEENGLQGRIDRSVVNYLLKNKLADYNFDKFFLCGPEEMINVVSETLTDRGISKDQILFELFTTSEEGVLTEAHEGNTKITLIVDDETEHFVMDQKNSVLQAALDQGLDVPYSCQGGICSSCIARVTEGKVEMRKNQILTDDELAEGLVLTCQSHPTTPTLIVDYDDV
ncbi:MAG: 2Fe-2S iron-sulfur cluster binding domain-containing protein [Flavobacteriaceae bacterium]|nr:2Fe-2S iron-sulfur cluster binding domain-containing protein [Flavobacteriaceae bacterium]